MHHFPGVPWREWPDLPYELVCGCIEYIDSGREG
jgi:hypothetical protein